MSVEMTLEDLDRYSREHQSQYELPKDAAVKFGWRNFLLEDAELRRFEILKANASRISYFKLQVRLVSQFTGIPPHMIKDTRIQGEILSIIPRLRPIA